MSVPDNQSYNHFYSDRIGEQQSVTRSSGDNPSGSGASWPKYNFTAAHTWAQFALCSYLLQQTDCNGNSHPPLQSGLQSSSAVLCNDEITVLLSELHRTSKQTPLQRDRKNTKIVINAIQMHRQHPTAGVHGRGLYRIRWEVQVHWSLSPLE